MSSAFQQALLGYMMAVHNLLLLFEPETHCVVQAGLELNTQSRLVSNDAIHPAPVLKSWLELKSGAALWWATLPVKITGNVIHNFHL